ncbi:helix-hairpin-helix domain-containing protein [Mucilaginibacter sp.]|uniref:helix-hairpin-helix domain-containing protein n=1 Tax=Mucilaginibacter sp. TaxID=1882438 RepID=UPI002612B6E6|nr:helix-hairpin-helix domain-containing protein [Mucilaginibacter sp.]
MKSRVKNYLSITKKEWNGMVILLLIIAIIFAAPYVYQQFHTNKVIDFKDFNKDAVLLNQAKGGDVSGYNDNGAPLSDEKVAKPTLFVFNPNNLPAEQWKQLGMSERQISIIKHYEAKGGHFNKKEDVEKIYGITADDYKRIVPYINIPDEGYTANKLTVGEVVDLNTADSTKLTRIHGIGPAFAARIVEYRKRLGGFLNKEQLKEVYGIDSIKYAEIQNQVNINTIHISKININAVDFEGLRKFPYLTNKQTNAVIQYRLQHGNYQSINDMKNIAIVDGIILRKIEPYLSFK